MLNNLDLRINWLLTLWINFTKLPFTQAWKLPILIYGWKSEIKLNKLILDIPSKCVKFGIIKIGCMFEVCTWAHYGAIIHSKGVIKLNGSCVIGRGFSFWGGRRSMLSIGKNSVINGNCSVHCKEKIQIGDSFSCAWNVSISDTDFHACRDMITNVLYSESAPVIIGKNVWIGQHALIAKGSVIPDWTIVCQSATTNRRYNCEPYSVLAGYTARLVPNKSLRREDMYERDLYEEDYLISKGFKMFNLKQ